MDQRIKLIIGVVIAIAGVALVAALESLDAPPGCCCCGTTKLLGLASTNLWGSMGSGGDVVDSGSSLLVI